MGNLRIIRAGAGSGKTYRLCEVVADAVANGLDPARILATTFTRKAAAELKGRIQARLLDHATLSSRDRIAQAERLELAAIGTVHSVGHRLLSRYALPLGFSPELTVLEETGSTRALHELLGQMPVAPWEDLARLTYRLSLAAPQDIVLGLLEAKRGNRIADAAFREQMVRSADRLVALMAPEGPSAPVGFAGLYDLARTTLRHLDRIRDETKTTREAKQMLRRLCDARRDSWIDFCRVATLSAGITSGADAALEELRGFAATVLVASDLHRDLREFLRRLADQVLAVEQAYAAYKESRGFLDFTDLEVWLLRLLETPDLAENLSADLALVVVDEFHDTNPLQLAIFQRLRGLVAESCWVGDAKQSIYGFRGTDPDLVRAVWDGVPASARDRLEMNYRSQAGLVELVGEFFRPSFGDEAVLRPKRPGAPRGVERWVITARNVGQEYAALARGIAALRSEGRSLREIAVLTRTNDQAVGIGASCRAAGMPALLELPGLLTTREGALALAGLWLVADRNDSLAATTILHLLSDPSAATPAWLDERLRAVQAEEEREGKRRRPWEGDPRLAPLEAIDHRVLPPSVALQEVLDALRIGDAIRQWGSAAERLANLDALLFQAVTYEQEMRIAGWPATLPGLISYLEALADSGEDLTRPPYGIEAVRVVTYHSAKGLEWPVVILTGLDFERDPDMWKVWVTGGDPAAEDPLAGRAIRYWPWPFGEKTKGTNLVDLALASPEGREAEERSEAERMRLLYVGFTRAKDVLVLAHRVGKYAWLETLPDIDLLLPLEPEGERLLPGIQTTSVLRKLDGAAAMQGAPLSTQTETWQAALQAPVESVEPITRYWSPSEAEGVVPPEAVTVETLPGEPIFPKMGEDQEVALGNSVHAYLTALPSLEGLGADEHRIAAARCLQGFSAESLLAADQLVAMGERFKAWVSVTYPGSAWHTEVPVTAPRAAGGQWNGSVDLLLRLSADRSEESHPSRLPKKIQMQGGTPQSERGVLEVRRSEWRGGPTQQMGLFRQPGGEVVVVDHKCGPIRRDRLAAKAATYAGQLAAYREALAAQELTVAATWIHFPMAAGMVRMDAG
jgi:superfamily I DNA/RNA helicase